MNKVICAMKDFNDLNTSIIIAYNFSGLVDDTDLRDKIKNDLLSLNDFSIIDNINKYINRFNVVDSYSKRLSNIIILINNVRAKYGINSINEFEDKIINYWDEQHIYDIELLSDVVHHIKYSIYRNKTTKLDKIYMDMINEDLIDDPNIEIGSSNEPFYTMLPSCEKYIDCNLKVISNSKVDWSLMRNGTTSLEVFVNCYNNEDNKILKKYYHDLIILALKNSLCVFNDVYYNSRNAAGIKKNIGLVYLSLYPSNGYSHKLNDNIFIDEINDYILSEEGFNHQINMYKDINDDANRAISNMKENRNKIKTKY